MTQARQKLAEATVVVGADFGKVQKTAKAEAAADRARAALRARHEKLAHKRMGSLEDIMTDSLE